MIHAPDQHSRATTIKANTHLIPPSLERVTYGLRAMFPQHEEKRRGRPLRRLGLLQLVNSLSCVYNARTRLSFQDHEFAAIDIGMATGLAFAARREDVLPKPGRIRRRGRREQRDRVRFGSANGSERVSVFSYCWCCRCYVKGAYLSSG